MRKKPKDISAILKNKYIKVTKDSDKHTHTRTHAHTYLQAPKQWLKAPF